MGESHQADIKPSAVRRVLIYRLGSLGDTVVSLPCLSLIARKFPNAQRYLLTNVPVHGKAPAASAILEGSGLVHGYITYPVGLRPGPEMLRLGREISRFRPDVLIYLARSRGEKSLLRDKIFFRLCGVRRMIGVPHGTLATNRFLPESNRWEAEPFRLARSLAALGDAMPEDLSNWDLKLAASEVAAAEALLAPFHGQPYIACAIGTKMQAKDWGVERWRGLLDRLAAFFPNHKVLLLGAAEEREVSDSASTAWSDRRINLCGQTSPRVSAAVLRHAEVFLGPDSGPMHLASAQGVPCVIAFASRTRPGVWYPLGEHHRIVYHELECSNCGLETCIEQQRKCLTSIAVDEMLQAVLSVLNRPSLVHTLPAHARSHTECTS